MRLGNGRRLVGCAAGLAIVCGLALPGAALGATTIGSSLSGISNVGFFGGPTYAQLSLQADRQASGGLTAPGDGVIVRWRILAGDPTPPIELRVLRPGGAAGTFAGAGTSPTADPANHSLSTFEVNPGLPIRAGDRIGLDLDPTEFLAAYQSAAGTVGGWEPQLADGGPALPPTETTPGFEQLIQAVVEPDRDGDRLGDETQDPCVELGPLSGPIGSLATALGPLGAVLRAVNCGVVVKLGL